MGGNENHYFQSLTILVHYYKNKDNKLQEDIKHLCVDNETYNLFYRCF